MRIPLNWRGKNWSVIIYYAGLSEPGPGLGGHETPQILTDQLTLSQQGGTDYAHHITTGPLGFLDLPTAL